MKNTNDKQAKMFRRLDIHTRTQRSKYYEKVVKWNTFQIERVANATAGENGRYGVQQYHIDSAQSKLDTRLGMLMLEWLKDAEEFFNAKLQVMSAKLDGFGFLEDSVILDFSTMHVSDNGDFEFWISGMDRNTYESLGRVHARLIPVDGTEKCFHYRFITTLKK